jgi:Na+/H+ antiporter NhaC
LRNVPVSSVRIEALTAQGEIDADSFDSVSLTGLKIVRSLDGSTETDEPKRAKLTNGTVEFLTQLTEGKRVYVGDDFSAELHGSKTNGNPIIVDGFWSLLPPVIAILLAILLKDVYVALLVAVYSGSLVLAGWDPYLAFTNLLDPTQKGFVAQAADSWNMQVIAFTLFLGAMIQVMSDSGGTQALVNRLSGQTGTRERGQLMTWFMGLLVFFDDYANTMLVGGAMRPVTDRLRISREKLAFIIDSTAAPIAGLAIVSTWVGVEVGYIGDGLESLGMDKGISYAVFLKTLPYRFYPLFLIGFVMLVAASGRDYGPMLAAETAALNSTPPEQLEDKTVSSTQSSMWLAIVPVTVLVSWIVIGFLLNFGNDDFDSVPLLLHGGFMAALGACVVAMIGGTLDIRQCARAWLKGMTEMFPAIIVLVLAWSVSSICKPGGLNTAGFIIEQIGDGVSREWMPTLAFVISGMVAFAIGSSYTTMGLLIPLFMSLVGYMLFGPGGIRPTADHPLMLATIGAILAGSIFGDHCSPISDTTVLSSAGAKCDHLKHVATQMPYALSVGLISIIFGYLPAGYGMNTWLLLIVGFAACYVVVRFVGRRPDGQAVQQG